MSTTTTTHTATTEIEKPSLSHGVMALLFAAALVHGVTMAAGPVMAGVFLSGVSSSDITAAVTVLTHAARSL